MLISADSVTRVLYVCVCAIFFTTFSSCVFVLLFSLQKIRIVKLIELNSILSILTILTQFVSIWIFFFIFFLKTRKIFFEITYNFTSVFIVCVFQKQTCFFSDTSLNFVVFFCFISIFVNEWNGIRFISKFILFFSVK